MLKYERKKSQKTIRTLLQQKETEKLNAQLEFIENIKNRNILLQKPVQQSC